VNAAIGAALREPARLFDIAGKAAIVTGASGAFGRAAAIALGALGAKVLAASGDREGLATVADEVRAVGADVATVASRANSIDEAQTILGAALDSFGRADILVVAAGVNKVATIDAMRYEDWQDVMDANVRGAWLMAKALGTHFIARRVRGKVVFLSSVRSRLGNPYGYSAYCTAKAATDGLTRVLATEWGAHGICVNAIAPTVFRSKLTAWMFGDDERARATRARSVARTPLGRLGEPEDLIGMLVYLVSPASDFCTGQVMYVDGGYTAG
jgi:NAD(P)-dependent dehydrogenase (short-subunit alcohol dehydrogenase family)